MKKAVLSAVIPMLLTLGFLLFPLVYAAPPAIKRPMELYIATIEGAPPETVDPAWCYDTASAELISSVYETLIYFDGESLEQYIPQLATEWTIEDITGTTSPEGLDWYFRYTFKIRSGVPFHGGEWGPAGTYMVTPEDVEYSFERWMVQDRDGGPTWMAYEPLLDTYGADGLGDLSITEDVIKIGKMIDHAVESNSTHVWFNLAFPGAYAPLMQILAQSWSCILSKAWVNDYVIGTLGRPDWNGDWGDYTTWIELHNPEISPLDDPSAVMCGTGPFYFQTLDLVNNFWSILRFTDYWRGWPAKLPAPPYPSNPAVNPTPAGYVDVVKNTWAYTWETRRDMFLAGDIDICAVPREYMGQVVDEPGIRCIYPLSMLAVGNLFYTLDIDPTSPYGTINDYGVFSEGGIPRDFFGNVHVRKAFSYTMDYDSYLATAFLGEAIQPATAIIPGLLYYDPSVQGYYYDLTKAEEEFKAVPGLWETGFTITICYNTGNIPRQRAAEYLKDAIESLNPKFHAEILALDWGTQYLPAMVRGQLSCFIIGWLADYPDPHNFATPFYHSQGTFSEWQGYSNPEMDALIDAGIKESDPEKRAQIYHDIQVLAIEDCPNVPLYDAIGRHFERDWVAGWYYNIIWPGTTGMPYCYHVWKWYYTPHSTYDTTIPQPECKYLPVDINYDGKVDMIDIGWVSKAYGATYGPPLHSRWNFKCDVNNDRKVDMIDIGLLAKNYGKTSGTWAPPVE